MSIDLQYGTRKFPLSITTFADIIWEEYNGRIRYIKHPTKYVLTHQLNDDEIKEFRWVKLSAVPYNGSRFNKRHLKVTFSG